MYLPINGPVEYGAVSVNNITATELKVGVSPLDERKVLVVQPLGNRIYLGFDNLVTTVTGMELSKRQIFIFEASEKVNVYAIASSGTVDVRIWELG